MQKIIMGDSFHNEDPEFIKLMDKHIGVMLPVLMDLIIAYGCSHSKELDQTNLPNFFLHIGGNIFANLLITVYKNTDATHEKYTELLLNNVKQNLDKFYEGKSKDDTEKNHIH